MTFAQAASVVAGIAVGGGGDSDENIEQFDELAERTITEASGNATSIGGYAFCYCSALTTANFPSVTIIGSNAFQSCKKLTTASFPNATTIGGNAFANCYNLVSLYLLGSTVPTLISTNAFTSTPLYNYSASAGKWGSIYVRASLYNKFITATYWSNASIKARIVSLTDAQIAALG